MYYVLVIVPFLVPPFKFSSLRCQNIDFDKLSERLVKSAASASADRDVGHGDDDNNVNVPLPPLTITIPPLNPATLSNAAHRATVTPAKKTSIPLKTLFKYPAAADPLDESGMNSFWKGGVQNLDNEMKAYELLSSGLSELSEPEGNNVNPEIPAMH